MKSCTSRPHEETGFQEDYPRELAACQYYLAQTRNRDLTGLVSSHGMHRRSLVSVCVSVCGVITDRFITAAIFTPDRFRSLP
jgi:hypothetical protein